MNSNIYIKQDLRPCTFRFVNTQMEGLFHKWTNDDTALVELENGTLAKVEWTRIKFLDTEEYYRDICWK